MQCYNVFQFLQATVWLEILQWPHVAEVNKITTQQSFIKQTYVY